MSEYDDNYAALKIGLFIAAIIIAAMAMGVLIAGDRPVPNMDGPIPLLQPDPAESENPFRLPN